MSPKSLAIGSVIVGIFPFTVALFATWIAQFCGIELSEANPADCIVLGFQIGGFLYGMFVFAWMSMLSLGIMIWGLLFSLVWAIIRKRKAKQYKEDLFPTKSHE